MNEEFLKYLPYAMSKYDRQGFCIYHNKKELEFRGIPTKELKTIYDSFDEKEIQNLSKALTKLEKENDVSFFEYEKKSKFYKIRLTLDNEDNIITSTTDVSYEKKLEQ